MDGWPPLGRAPTRSRPCRRPINPCTAESLFVFCCCFVCSFSYSSLFAFVGLVFRSFYYYYTLIRSNTSSVAHSHNNIKHIPFAICDRTSTSRATPNPTDTKSTRPHSRACLGIAQYRRNRINTLFADDLNYQPAVCDCVAHNNQRTINTSKPNN